MYFKAHCYARWVLTKVCLEAGQGFVTIEECTGEDGKPDLKFKLNKDKIDSVGKPAVSAFLTKLQAYKSTGDVAGGTAMFESYGAIDETAVAWRNICIARRKPRRPFVQCNTVLNGSDVELVNYPSTTPGIIQSFVDRYEVSAIDELEQCWKNDQKWYSSAYTQ